MKVLALQHVPFEDLGAFAPALARRGYEIEYRDAGEPLEDDGADLVVVLGGPIGVYEVRDYPFIADEIALVQRRLARGAPIVGVCLGAQIMAAAAGARVYPSGAKHIGIAPIALTDAGCESCLAPFAAEPLTLHWHGDTFDLPEGVTLLASTEKIAHQAFALGPSAVGFQFHPEAGGPGFERWLVGHACELAAAGVDVPDLRAGMARHGAALAAKAGRVLDLWLDEGRGVR
jgi:GMP synthase (glutamine-hydrolysing)